MNKALQLKDDKQTLYQENKRFFLPALGVALIQQCRDFRNVQKKSKERLISVARNKLGTKGKKNNKDYTKNWKKTFGSTLSDNLIKIGHDKSWTLLRKEKHQEKN